MAKKKVAPTSFAFLDIMFCGFGSVVLLVIILNGDILKKRQLHSQDLRAELKRVTALEEFAQNHLYDLRKQIEEAELEQGQLQIQTNRLSGKVQDASRKAEDEKSKSTSLEKSIAAIKAQNIALENTARLLRSKNVQKWESGNKPIGFTGDGQRQYLTGLKLGGKRTLILVDTSASMLDETVVNIVRRKLMGPEVRKTAPKWQRALKTLHWLMANLRPGKEFQVYQFSTDAKSLIPGTGGQWVSTDDTNQLTSTIAAAKEIAPIGGTSLHQAFGVINKLNPKPDSVILITDGLPTQAQTSAKPRTVSSEDRLLYFNQSTKLIPRGIPINTLLFPMEGDPGAAGAFWELAISTRGSFITPTRDWP